MQMCVKKNICNNFFFTTLLFYYIFDQINAALVSIKF